MTEESQATESQESQSTENANQAGDDKGGQQSSSDQIPAFVSKSQSVADQMESMAFGEQEAGSDKSEPEEKEGLSKKEADSDDEGSKKDESESSDSSESDDSTEKAEGESSESEEKDKDNVQKRIDKLIAERNAEREKAEALEQRLNNLEKKFSKPEKSDEGKDGKSSEEREFTDQELKVALKKFIDEDNTEGVFDVLQYMNERTEKKLVKRYEDEIRQKQETVKKKNLEWQSIVQEFSPDAYDEEEIKGNPDFDIQNQDGLLYKIAEAYFSDNELAEDYKGEGGMKRAVQDAFQELLILNMKKSKETEAEPSKKKTTKKTSVEAKKNQKQALGSGADDVGDSETSKPFSANDELAEAMKERREFKKKRVPASV